MPFASVPVRMNINGKLTERAALFCYSDPMMTTGNGAMPALPPAGGHARMRRRARENRLALGALFIAGLIAVALVIAIVLFVLLETAPLFTDPELRGEAALRPAATAGQDTSVVMTLDNLLGQPLWQPVSEPPLFGLWPLLVGTLKITLVAVTLGMVVSFFAAVAMSFYLPKRLRYAAKVITELLAGIPTVALGFLGLMFFAGHLQEITGSLYQLNALLAGAVLSLTVIPILTTLLEEIYTGYPRDQIHAAKCCGLFNYQIITRLVLPAAWGKMMAAALLGLGRCFGETMIVLMLSGNAAVAQAGLLTGARTISATIGAEMAEVVVGGAHYSALFLLGLLLIIVTFTVNYISQALIRRWTYA